jgi:hypothetical protein
MTIKTELFYKGFWGRNCLAASDYDAFRECIDDGSFEKVIDTADWKAITQFYNNNQSMFMFGFQSNNLFRTYDEDTAYFEKLINVISPGDDDAHLYNIEDYQNKYLSDKSKKKSALMDKLKITSEKIVIYDPLNYDEEASDFVQLNFDNGIYLLTRTDYSLPNDPLIIEEITRKDGKLFGFSGYKKFIRA